MTQPVRSQSTPFPPAPLNQQRSRSPSYLRNTLTGERRIRRSWRQEEEISEQKLERKTVIDSSLARTTAGSRANVKDSRSIETQTSRTDDDSTDDSQENGNKRQRQMRSSRNVFSLVSPRQAQQCTKKKKNRRSIGSSLGHSNFPKLSHCNDTATVQSNSSLSHKEKNSKKAQSIPVTKPVDTTSIDTKSIKCDEEKSVRLGKSFGSTSSVASNKSKSSGRSVVKDNKKERSRKQTHSTSWTESSTSGRPVNVIHWKSEEPLKEEDSSARILQKTRSTVDENGKIRRKNVVRTELVGNDDDSSRVSYGSKPSRSSKSTSRKKGAIRSNMGSSFSSSSPRSSGLQRQGSMSFQSSQRSFNGKSASILQIYPIESTDLQKELDSLQEELLTLKAAEAVGRESASKAKRAIREIKLELQKSNVDRQELQARVREQEHSLKEKEAKIVVLEKAVENQLEKVDELEAELRRAYEEIFVLESRVADYAGLDEASAARVNEKGNLQEIVLKSDFVVRTVTVSSNEDAERKVAEEINKSRLCAKKNVVERFEEGEYFVESTVTAESPSQLDESHSVCDKKIGVEIQHVNLDVKLLKSKWEGAHRRNLILEEDLQHWKSVSCGLEEELDELKAQSAMWKAKYLLVKSSVKPSASRLSPAGLSKSPADTSITQADEDSETKSLDGSQSSIASFWTKLTKTTRTRCDL